MRQYKIWNEIYNTEYKKSNSFGTNGQVNINMLIGTSSKNSHDFAKITQDVYYSEENDCYYYDLLIDGVVIKEAQYYPKTKTFKQTYNRQELSQKHIALNN